MGKKVSAQLFRINKFNNYKNKWVFTNYNISYNITILHKYIIMHNIVHNNNILTSIYFYYFNNNVTVLGKVYNKVYYKFYTNFLLCYFKFMCKNTIYINLYRLVSYYKYINFLKLFVKINLLRHFSIKQLYQKLYYYLVNRNNLFLGIKIIISGRLERNDLSNSDIFKFGYITFNKINMYVEYDFFYLNTKYGVIGIKIWVLNYV
uniref:Ribosomal protein S3 n=1 Tax=Hepatozoon canis TaxID=110120 RepID=A0A3S8TEJ8_9APIC|nr:ribosomal protein S3 [Hepatozoon canis]